MNLYSPMKELVNSKEPQSSPINAFYWEGFEGVYLGLSTLGGSCFLGESSLGTSFSRVSSLGGTIGTIVETLKDNNGI